MKLNRFSLILVSCCLLFCACKGNAAISVSPSIVPIGQTVTATLSRFLPKDAGTLSLRINFGDGSSTVFSPTYGPATGTYSFSATHSYSQAGTYTVRGQSFIIKPSTPLIPISESRSVTVLQGAGSPQPGGTNITVPVEDLPRGIVGEKYQYSLASTPGSRSNRYRVTRPILPPGLRLQTNGVISGIPIQKGKFTFTVQVFTQSGTSFFQELILFVDPGVLTLEVTPNVIEITRGGGTNQRVTFTVISPTVQINETIRSTRGEFVAAGRVIGYVNSPMNINLNTPRPSGREKIKISSNVLKAAQRAGTSNIRYRRVFHSTNLEQGSGETKIDMRTAAAGQLRITKLRIFFEQNNRPLIVVERNSRNLTGVIEIHYNGSGAFKGYWKVGERIIQRVQKNMFYGKVLTLKTPNAPPLPTYSEGAHRLQFIITEPESSRQKIDFPEAIYHVQAKKAEFVARITLTAPENRAQFDTSGAAFTWTEPPRVATYLVEFFEDDADDPSFTAYTKQGSYALPAKILSLKFKTARDYRWHIRGFSSEGLLNAESSDRYFEMLE